MIRGGVALLALGATALAAAAGCAPRRPPAAAAQARYLIGQPYALGGLWSYPREDFALTETGLAGVIPDARAGRATANGEVYDPAALLASHRTLQLPAILTVTDLETGREIQVRVNDRGPAQPGRLLGLSRRAAELLGVPPGVGGAAQVRIAVDGAASRALAAALPATPGEARALPIAAAPRGRVEAEALAPLPGARAVSAALAPHAAAARPAAAKAEPRVGAAPPPPDRLPETVARRAPTPGRLVVEAGSFFRADLARHQAGRLAAQGAQVEGTGGPGRQAEYRVRMGPFDTVAEADRAVAAVLAAGLPEVRVVVE